MAITIAEAKQRRVEVGRIAAEASMLSQWYFCLERVLTDQAVKGLEEPDFSRSWLMCTDEVRDHLNRVKDVMWTQQTWDMAVLQFIDELISDQLEEYGVHVQLKSVSNLLGTADRFYIVRPGQDPAYN